MTTETDKPLVYDSIENDEHDRCVDFFKRMDETFGFAEFRRDIEDQGRWTPIGYFGGARFVTHEEAVRAARQAVGWFAERMADD